MIIKLPMIEEDGIVAVGKKFEKIEILCFIMDITKLG